MIKKTIYFLLLLASFSLTAQQLAISGSVSGSDGVPLPGATIQVLGTPTGTTSDFDGNFSLSASLGDTLLISFIGFESATIQVAESASYNVILTQDLDLLDEVVVTGYGTEKKSEITGAITIVDTEKLQAVATPNVITKLQSRVPGLNFTSSGVPGGNDTQITIRGITSVFGGAGPLWVIDGVQTTSPAGLNSNEIESIQVLKDAASAGIYGTEAARGVIVVTTKAAKEGKTEFNFSTSTNINWVRENFDVLSAQEWLDVRYKAQGNSAVTAGNFTYVPGMELPIYLDSANNLLVSNTNWINTILKTSLSYRTDFSASISKNNWKLFAGIGHVADNGIMEHTYFNRTNARLNSSISLLDGRLTIGENVTVSNFNEVKANAMEDAILQNPLIPVYGEDGTWGGPTGGGLQDKWNPLAILHINRNNVQKTLRTFGNVYADLKLTDNLEISSKFNFDINSFKYDEKTGAFNQNGSTLGNYIVNSSGDAMSRFTINRNDAETFVFTNLLKYNNSFGNHNISAFAGHEIYEKTQNNTLFRIEVPYGSEVDYENPSSYTVLQDSSILDAYGIGADSKRESMFGKLSYNYDEKYFVSGSVRRDGSSRFGRNNRYAVFPTASLGWTLTKENFLLNSNTINNLKLRASWGSNGNADILEYAQYSIYNQALENSNYDIAGGGNGDIGQGVSPNQVGNPDLKWEQSFQTNLGLDANLFDNQVSLVVDVYKKTTTDLLLQIVQPSVLGEAGKTLFFNAGDMENVGIDAVLGISPKTNGPLTFGVDFTFSAYENEVTKLNNEDNFILEGVSYTAVGHPIGSYFGYIADGIFRSPEEVAVHANQPGKALGNIRYRDLNGDGTVNQDDRTVIGNPHPDFIYGINLNLGYQNLSLSVFFDGRYGNDMYNAQRELLDFPYFGFNHGKNTLDAWALNNANSMIPKLNTADVNDQKRASTYFIEDGTFFRMKTVNLTYTLSDELLEHFNLDGGNFYIQGENLLNFTTFSGFDYEVPGLSRTGIGIAGLATYPHTQTVSVGFNLKF